MSKSVLILIGLGVVLLAGCNKAPAENPNAQIKGPSQTEMQNIYANRSQQGGGGAMGRPMAPGMGAGAPYGSQGGAPR
jgi:hypothetical protein